MAVATLAVQQYTGAGPSADTVTTPRLSTSDNYNPGTANPIPIADSGLAYSYWMTLHLTITAMNDATLLNNHVFYSDEGTDSWMLGTDGLVRVGLRDSGDNGVPVGNYDQATGEEGVSGDDMEDDVDGHAYYKDQSPETGDVADYTSVSTLLIDSGDHSGAEAFKGVVLQAVVDDDATRGAQAASTLTFQYDEI
jgi:hypothetical protein